MKTDNVLCVPAELFYDRYKTYSCNLSDDMQLNALCCIFLSRYAKILYKKIGNELELYRSSTQ